MATLDEVISAIPQLGMACSAVLTIAVPGSGLKLMRLVSRQMSTVMLGMVQGYTLQLDGRSPGLFTQMALLALTRMSHLRVVVSDRTAGELGPGGYSNKPHFALNPTPETLDLPSSSIHCWEIWFSNRTSSLVNCLNLAPKARNGTL